MSTCEIEVADLQGPSDDGSHLTDRESVRSMLWLYERLMPIAVAMLAALYLVQFVYRGWIPHDEGTLAQAAERVMGGQMPHRDFFDPYTGGLAYLYALGFKYLGTSLSSIRLIFFGFATLLAPTLYLIAARWMKPAAAAVVALTCMTWSVPNYFAGMPSWYTLFLATFGIWALLRYLDTKHRRWLFLAGLFGGVSIVIKIVGLYYVAASLLFLMFHEQCTSDEPHELIASDLPGTRRSLAYLVFTALVAGAFSTLLVLLVRKFLYPMEALNYVLPGAALAAVLVWNEWRCGRGSLIYRLGRLLRLTVPLALGAAIPVASFVAPYYAQGALPELYYGVFVAPQLRFTSVAFPLPSPVALLFPLGLLALLAGATRFKSQRVPLLVIGLIGVPLALIARGGLPYQMLWDSLRCSLPVISLVACAWLVRQTNRSEGSSNQPQVLFLLTAMAALVGLMQFPFSAPIYFCYVAPLMLLTAQFLMSTNFTSRPVLQVAWLLPFLTFALLWMNPGNLYTLGFHYSPYVADQRLELERGGLTVPAEDANVYQQLVTEIQSRTAANAFILATPDCPEIYFLSGRRNPTPTLYDVFDVAPDRTARLLRMLDEKKIDLVVVNLKPAHSPPIDQELSAALKARYPKLMRIGSFVVATGSADVATK